MLSASGRWCGNQAGPGQQPCCILHVRSQTVLRSTPTSQHRCADCCHPCCLPSNSSCKNCTHLVHGGATGLLEKEHIWEAELMLPDTQV